MPLVVSRAIPVAQGNVDSRILLAVHEVGTDQRVDPVQGVLAQLPERNSEALFDLLEHGPEVGDPHVIGGQV